MPFSANGLWPVHMVKVVNGSDLLQPIQTSKHVTRFRCKDCGSPVKADLMGGKVVALPLAAFNPEQVQQEGCVSFNINSS